MEHITAVVTLLMIYPIAVKGICGKKQYQCFDGSCIDINKFCDSNQDCLDNSDEDQCYMECIQEADPRGRMYRGRRNITYSGLPCQQWSSQYPNIHRYFYPDTDENFCRNVNDKSNDVFPFCFANSTVIRWQKCDIPFCDFKPFNCSFDENTCGWHNSKKGSTSWTRTRKYGYPDHTSENGKFLATNLTHGNYATIVSPYVNLTKRAKCVTIWVNLLQGQNSVINVYLRTPHQHFSLTSFNVSKDFTDWTRSQIYTDEENIFQVEIEAGLSGMNGFAFLAIDDISIINEICPGTSCSNEEYQCNDGTCIDMNRFCDFFPDCEDLSDETNCKTDCILPSDDFGINYVGSRSQTASGQTCVEWKSTYGIFHNFEEVKSLANVCRNPDGRAGPWCFSNTTTGSWEYCGIHRCAKECLPPDDPHGMNYRGVINVTKCGNLCQRWDVQTPHKHNFVFKENIENYCRNFGDHTHIWCYTQNASIRWEECPPLQQCVPAVCSEDEWLCNSGQCIPLDEVDDGKFDCLDYSDEQSINCNGLSYYFHLLGWNGNYSKCPADFRCRTTISQPEICLLNNSLCNGHVNCPYQEDESTCFSSDCPESCKCSDLSAKCSFSPESISKLPRQLRSLDVSLSTLDFSKMMVFYFPLLVHLNLSHTGLQTLVSNQTLAIGFGCENLQTLDLRYNQLSVLPTRGFQRMFRLRSLLLEGNPIKLIENNAFHDLNLLREVKIPGAFVGELKKYSLGGLNSLSSFDLSRNKIEMVDPLSFLDSGKIEFLNLSYNFLTMIGDEFWSTPNLEVLDLSFNKIKHIKDTSFQGMTKMQELRLQGNMLKLISFSLFAQLISLKLANLSQNHINDIEKGTFSGLTKVISIDLRNNYLSPYRNLFRGLTNLKELYVDSYTICCVKPDNLPAEKCYSPQDKISSCLFLIKEGFLSISIWFLALMAILGNLIVIIYRLNFEKWKNIHTYKIFVLNLTVSDLLMGIYLFIIAYKDNEFRGYYFLHDKEWRDSVLCSVSGILATVSSETSAIFILFITVDRFLGIKYTFSSFRFTKRSAIIWSILVWCFTMIIAIVPVTDIDYFQGKFYSASGVCLSLPLSASFEYGHIYSFSVFIVLNFIIFCGICIGQILIFREIRSVRAMIVRQSSARSSEAAAARSLFMVVMTDILCWLPIAIMGLMVVFGFEIPVDMYAWLVVLVLPVNSAINPYLYTMSSLQIFNRKSVKDKTTSSTKTTNVLSSRF